MTPENAIRLIVETPWEGSGGGRAMIWHKVNSPRVANRQFVGQNTTRRIDGMPCFKRDEREAVDFLTIMETPGS
jgi:hypothetical protein